MSLITVMPSGKTVEAAEGTSLMQAISQIDGDFKHKSGDTCDGSCHLFLLEGRKGVSKVSREENEKLDMIVGVGSKSRLACQATVLGTEDIKVEVLDFASGF
ncbi:2Fe-2S iron-sulfur cluster-binding protein [Roseibium marinum]|uniref:2Fe-2S ferredoxin n=1 Tax=Roseibium marinum TaxID=281252 RepID=A0A2S3V1N0_9HYPH|nr:2Fe-2S iron-sulfur cluster-binding protein [Roseibium marinum]POF33874.1 2Fe-2S ferredoxin [Roseibium marinum]